jgi:hypothetical protein
MTHYAYVFEVKSIQTYLFATGRMKDAVAGSQVLDQLLNAPLAQTLAACEATAQFSTTRCAGGALYGFFTSESHRARFSALWPMVVQQMLPGIEMAIAMGQHARLKNAMTDALADLQSARNFPRVLLPLPTTFTLRSARTGRAATAFDRAKKESIDEATSALRSYQSNAALEHKFSADPKLAWPINLSDDEGSDMAFRFGPLKELALVHADGNGLGNLLLTLGQLADALDDEQYQALYEMFSTGLERATIAAAQATTIKVLVPVAEQQNWVMPARPIVLGGDDITLLVQAEYAFDFTVAFINEFEQASEVFINQINQRFQLNLPARLTCCAGIVFLKPKQPFALAHELAEQLCQQAKQVDSGREKPSALAFMRMLDSHTDGTFSLAHSQVRVKLERHRYELGYLAQPDEQFIHLRNLAQLALAGLVVAPLREIATLLGCDPKLALVRYARWRQIQMKEHPALLAEFDTLYAKLLPGCDPTRQAWVTDDQQIYAPIVDFFTMLRILTAQQWLSNPIEAEI